MAADEKLLSELRDLCKNAPEEKLQEAIEETNYFWVAGIPARPSNDEFIALRIGTRTIAEVRISDVSLIEKEESGIWRIRIGKGTKFIVTRKNVISPGPFVQVIGAARPGEVVVRRGKGGITKRRDCKRTNKTKYVGADAYCEEECKETDFGEGTTREFKQWVRCPELDLICWEDEGWLYMEEKWPTEIRLFLGKKQSPPAF